jgi:GNAT superfamily N-acetyltransferase
MFVLELSKPSGMCLAAVRGEELVGYLVCSRYDTVWHVMNVSVDPDHRRRGIATELLERLFASVPERDSAQFTLEVRESNRGAMALYEELGFRRPGSGGATTRTTARTRDHVAHPGDPAGAGSTTSPGSSRARPGCVPAEP